MKIELWMVGKTNFDFLKDGIEIYEKRSKTLSLLSNQGYHSGY